MTIRVGMITIDTADARAPVGVVGGSVRRRGGRPERRGRLVLHPGHAGWHHLRLPAADPTPGKNRLHVDFSVPDRRAAVESMVAQGAVLVAERDLSQFGTDFAWTVLADPEGNQFCVAELDGS